MGATGAEDEAEPAPDGEDRLFTIPNLVTVARLCLLPVFLWLLFGRDDQGAAAVLLAVLGATDWVDGYLARRFGWVSDLGKSLDPVADRLLFFVGIGGILLDGSCPWWFGVAVLVREVVIASVTVTLAVLGATRIDVTWYGKAGTFALMFAFPLFLVGASDLFWSEVGQVLAWVFGLPGLVLSYIAAFGYLPLAPPALREGRGARSGAGSPPPPG